VIHRHTILDTDFAPPPQNLISAPLFIRKKYYPTANRSSMGLSANWSDRSCRFVTFHLRTLKKRAYTAPALDIPVRPQ